ncbi:MAG: hypothetical protein C5B51_22975 [Terriglobia bacterium]|nr:MAG: hypothetical protein C5B51_22975 [Terriglobia bacterium]
MDVIGQLAAVAAVLFLLAGTLWWFRRRGFAVPVRGGRTGGRRLEAIERLPLGPQQVLHLVRLGEKVLLVAASPAGCTLIDSFSWREIDSAPEMLR